MEDVSRLVLEILRTDDRLSWVRDQVAATLAEGVVESAKSRDSGELVIYQEHQALSPAALRRERTKREKYETSRPYRESERIDLIERALKDVFLTVPALETGLLSGLRELGAAATIVEFLPPEEEESEASSSAHVISSSPDRRADLSDRVNRFVSRLRS